MLPRRLSAGLLRSGRALLRDRVTTERRVLFVCVENAGRSLLAEAIFNADPPAGWRADSAGTRPARAPHLRTRTMLAELGLALPPHPPRVLDPARSDAAAIRISMGCLDDASCPAFLRGGVTEDWELPDPERLDDAGFRAVRDEIARRVRALTARLAAGDAPKP